MDLIKLYNEDSNTSTSLDEIITQPKTTTLDTNSIPENKYLEILSNDVAPIKKEKQREKTCSQFSAAWLKDIDQQVHACLGTFTYFCHFNNV